MSVCQSEFGSDHDDPQCSPRPVPSVESKSTTAQNATSAEQHAYVTTGVSLHEQNKSQPCTNEVSSVGELKTAQLNALFANAKKSTPTTWKYNSLS